ncbi:hypothetical protein [Oleidesulfovibrio sp.]|uniref:hypothetical protein n=1 Tax=Oleidesulfovibrio sp. TaxID=2909707 RepID=UPI003A8A9EB6
MAREIRAMRLCDILFALGSDHAQERVRQHGYVPLVLPDDMQLEQWLSITLHEVAPDILLLDAPEGFPVSLAAQRVANGKLTVILDDAGPLRRYAHAAYYPPAPVLDTLDWTDCPATVHSGFEWVALGETFSPRPRIVTSGPVRILLTMGGSDPQGFTLRALQWLKSEHLRNLDWRASVIAGPYFALSMQKEIVEFLKTADMPIEVITSPPDMGAIMASCDFAVASFGVSAYELACCGVPAAYICLTRQHSAMADVFEHNGIAINLGVHHEICDEAAVSSVAALLHKPEQLENMGQTAAQLVDGLGAQRIAADMIRRMEIKI